MTVTNVLIALNVVAYIWELTTGAMQSDPRLIAHGALYGPLVVVDHQYWRIVSSAFLHYGLVHISFNMFALYQVGRFVEYALGGPRMLAIYLIAMVGAGISVVLFSYNLPTVGASGAIFGLFGALVAIGIRLGPRGRGIIGQTLPIIGINLVLGFTIPNISMSAHIGGLLTGFVIGLALTMFPRVPAQAPAALSEEVTQPE
ncbi:MAG TPA: rhomboid family intramembrane serine protease [Candidatus Baltobacteraceae bacterium]|nr:rhomboid family intramembrane serine protease [Candidatus Baltobacteraceae bacterium]